MIFTLPLPETTNHAYAVSRGRMYKTKKAESWENEAGWVVKQSWKLPPIEQKVYIIMKIFVKRDRDIDGGIKPVLDLLQRQGVYKNDNQVLTLTVVKFFDKQWPRCEVQVEKI